MKNENIINQFIEFVNKYISAEEFEDTLLSICDMEGINYENVFGLVDSPDYIKGFISTIFGKIQDEYSTDSKYSFKNTKVLLDVLLYDMICSAYKEGYKYEVSENVFELLELEAEENDIDINLEIVKADTLLDYFYMIKGTEIGYAEARKVLDTDSSISTEKYRDFLEAKVQGVLSVYKELYEAGYEMFKPVGLLYNKGIIKNTKEGNIKNENALLQGVFNSINSRMGNVFTTADSLNGNTKPRIEYVKKGIYYYPNFQMRNVFGTAQNDDGYLEFINKLENSKIVKYSQISRYFEIELYSILEKSLLQILEENNGDLELTSINRLLVPVVAALETAIVVTEYNKGVCLKIKVCTGGLYNIRKEVLEEDISAGKLLGTSTEIEQFRVNNNVYTISFVMDRKKYEGFPLFAFQALEAVKRTGRPDWGSVVLGKKVSDDTILRRSFKANTDFLIALISGSRSGKGVMTLNLLASAMGAGYPIFYSDFKPDMSSTFYNIARKNGTEMYTFDGSWESKQFPRNCDILFDASSIPSELIEEGLDVKEFVLLVSYLRSMEFAVNLSRLRQKAINNGGKGIEELGGERVIFVFDEIELMSLKYRSLFEKYNKQDGLITKIVNRLTINMKPGERSEYLPYSYVQNFTNWASGVISDFSSCMSATFGQGRVSIFMIWQHTDIENLGMPLASLATAIKTNAIRIVGNGTLSGNGSKVLGAMAFKGTEYEKYFGQYCFAIAKDRGSEITPENSIVFKPYLLLNESSEQYLNELYSRCPEAKELIEVDGRVREDIAFEGYVKELLETNNISNLLGYSWEIAQNLIKSYGVARDLIEYMYNVHDFKVLRLNNDRDVEIDIDNIYEEYENYEGNLDNTNFFDDREPYNEELNNDTPFSEEVKNDDYDKETLETSEGVFNMPGRKTIKPVKYDEYIFKHNLFNITEKSFFDEKSMTDSINNLAVTLYAHIADIVGEDRVVSFAEKDRFLIVNDVLIAPRITEDIVEKLPYDIRKEVSDGRWASVFVFGYTRHFSNLKELIFSDIRFLTMKVLKDYGIVSKGVEGYEKCFKSIFKAHKALDSIYVGNERFDREEILNGLGLSRSKNTKSLFDTASRSNDIDEALRRATPESYKWGLSSFYKNPNYTFGQKTAATVGVGALAMLAMSNPVGVLAVGYIGGRAVVNTTVNTVQKIKRGLKAFTDAFKENIR